MQEIFGSSFSVPALKSKRNPRQGYNINDQEILALQVVVCNIHGLLIQMTTKSMQQDYLDLCMASLRYPGMETASSLLTAIAYFTYISVHLKFEINFQNR